MSKEQHPDQIRNELLGRVSQIDRELPDGWLAVVVVSSCERAAFHACVPLVHGAREHRMLRIPYFSVVYDGNSTHVLLDTHHIRLMPGHVGMIRGFMATGAGSFYVAQINHPDELDEMRNRILSLALTCNMQANTPLPPKEAKE